MVNTEKKKAKKRKKSNIHPTFDILVGCLIKSGKENSKIRGTYCKICFELVV